jgi:hydrogenase maturation protease
MTRLLGLGNVLMGDDGVGPSVIRAFEAAYVVDPDVEIVDLGTPGLDLLPWLADADRIVLVDTVKSERPPGTVIVYDKADIMRHPPMQRIGPHDPGVKDALFALDFAGRAPREVLLIGVVPETTAMSLELSPAVNAAIPTVVEHLVHALASAGVAVRPRSDAPIATTFWDSPHVADSPPPPGAPGR